MIRRGVSLVIGADGLVGRALIDSLLRAGRSVLETTRRSNTISKRRVFLDLRGDVSAWRLPCQTCVAYFCAAVSSMECCRREPAESAIVNVRNTVALAKTLTESGVLVIFLSTNLVYDGSKPFRKADDAVCPRTEYGRQKSRAEQELSGLGNLISIVRFTKVLGVNALPFKGWIQALQRGEVIRPFSDTVLSPVPLPFAIRVLHRIAELRLSGIVQVSGERDVTYEQVARHIAKRIGTDPDLVQPIRSREADPQLEAIPPYTTFDTTRLRMELGMDPPDVWSTIDSVFRP